MSSTDRAEDFLALVRRARQGRLKLFLGPAPGVGKTYRMLQEAHGPHELAISLGLLRGLVRGDASITGVGDRRRGRCRNRERR